MKPIELVEQGRFLGEVEVVEPGTGCGPLVLFGAFIVALMVLVGFSQW